MRCLAPGRKFIPRRATVCWLMAVDGQERLDHGLVIFFPAPESYTGEDMAEFHVHGGRSVIRSVLETIQRVPGFRPAEPGEFTRRAVLAGKMNLTEAEAVGELVAAQTGRQRIHALKQLAGGVSALCDEWHRELVEILSLAEAAIDFSDEPIPLDVMERARQRMAKTALEIGTALKIAEKGRVLRDGMIAALVGRPNVGKSSLLNRLAGEEAAIVADIPGTTRDRIDIFLELDGWPVRLIDMAGIRSVDTVADRIEIEGIRRASETAQSCDVRLIVEDAVTILADGGETISDLQETYSGERIVIVNKIDLISDGELSRLRDAMADCVFMSAITGAGLQDIQDRLAYHAGNLCERDEVVLFSTQRHIFHLENMHESLLEAQDEDAMEMMAHHLWQATRSLGKIVGRVDVEQILDGVFANFCIGK